MKYIKQLLNLWYLTIIQENKLTTRHVFAKAVNEDLAFEVYVWRINFMLELLRGLVVVKALNLYAKVNVKR